jgi:exodeoxyribonuclease VII small subunit
MSKARAEARFEDSLRRLDAIVAELEGGSIGIEQAADRYEEAMDLVSRCQKILEATELRIRKIQGRSAGDAPPEAAAEGSAPPA